MKLLVSPATRFVAPLVKTTKRPLPAMLASLDCWSACAPAESVDARLVAPVSRSLTKMSARALVSPATRLVAELSKTTKRPFIEIVGSPLDALASTPVLLVETRVVWPVAESLT